MEIKSEKFDNYEDEDFFELETVAERLQIKDSSSSLSTVKQPAHKIHSNNEAETLFDENCLNDLCTVFNRDNKWKTLATELGYQAFTTVWESSKNPSKMLFKFSEVIPLHMPTIVMTVNVSGVFFLFVF